MFSLRFTGLREPNILFSFGEVQGLITGLEDCNLRLSNTQIALHEVLPTRGFGE